MYRLLTMMYIKILLAVFVLSNALTAQAGFKILPEEIHFPDEFHRLENVYFINESSQPVHIDSIYYKKDIYYIRFNRPWQYPFVVYPSDTVLMDCILSKPYLIGYDDKKDTMFVYLENDQLVKVAINIDFYHSKIYQGKISGTVSSENNRVGNASVYFHREGKFLIDSASTDLNGYYEAWLPEGFYTVSAANNQHYLSFFNDQPSPLNPVYINITRSNESIVNLNLKPLNPASYTVTGRVYDKVSFGLLKRAIIIARKGVHNSGKSNNQFIAADDDEVYSALVTPDGDYQIPVPSEGYYSIQGFSDYYLPGYYNMEGTTLFWQEADSIYINSEITNKDLFFMRDSSFGAGIIKGKVTIPQQTDSSVSNIIILVKAAKSNSFIAYTNVEQNGNFQITNLPYGDYKLIAQKIGLADASSFTITIDSLKKVQENIRIDLIVSVERDYYIESFILEQNYPNPFNAVTRINYGFSGKGSGEKVPVKIKIFDILGNEITTLVNEYKAPGIYHVEFNANDYTSGVYFYQFQAGSYVESKKMILLK